MSGQELFVYLTVGVLLGLAGFFAVRQVLALRLLRRANGLSEEDRLYLRGQAHRRLWCSGLLLVLAGLLAGTRLLGLEERVDAQAARPAGMRDAAADQEYRQLARVYTLYWIGILLVLFGILLTALLDIWAIRRFSLRHQRQIQADRQAMIEEQAARYRLERNGHH